MPHADSHCLRSLRSLNRVCVCLHALSSFQRTGLRAFCASARHATRGLPSARALTTARPAAHPGNAADRVQGNLLRLLVEPTLVNIFSPVSLSGNSVELGGRPACETRLR